jgi:2-hydroxy-3-oxopropionate reductase
MRLGFIGLGVMGRPMAGHLLAAGYRVFLHSRSGVPHDLQEAGGAVSASPREVAEKADIVFTMVPDTPDVEHVLFAPEGVSRGLTPGKTVVDMSSISPLATRNFAEQIAAVGCSYLDAPVSGGEVGAKAASLTIMVGGEASVFARVEPLFRLMGKNVTHVGETGAGQITKVANQIIVALTIEAVSEAFVFAAKAGADPARVRAALMGGFASSRILEVHGERMLNRAFAPGFRIELHQKDLALALEGARQLGMSLPSTALAQQLFSACVSQGAGGWDHSALVTALERLAGCEVRSGDRTSQAA